MGDSAFLGASVVIAGVRRFRGLGFRGVGLWVALYIRVSLEVLFIRVPYFIGDL